MLKKIYTWGGSLIAIFGFLFLLKRINLYCNQINFNTLKEMDYYILILFIAIYCISNFLLVKGWQYLLFNFGSTPSFSLAFKIYGTSQLGKYIPGNIFQFAGRQTIAVKNGIKSSVSLKSIGWELGLLALSGSVFVILIMPLYFKTFSALLSVLVFILFLFILFRGLFYFNNLFYLTTIVYLVFLTISSLLFVGVLNMLNPRYDFLNWEIFFVIGSFVVAWLVGFVTPGAPAGVGVREFVLFFLLKNNFSESDILAALIFSRVISIIGDLIFFLIALTIKRQARLN
jgi:uncharacterized membrane protein YbhN (UPF0104 family)